MSNYKRIGDFIQLVDVRNKDLKVERLLGVNLDKKFMPSVANIVGTDLSKYKIIKKNQFGCKLMSVGRDKRLPISLLKEYEEALISSAYFVFEIVDKNKLLDDYLMMWLLRAETDRYLWFLSGADIRGRITWEDFCSIQLPVPSIEKQKEIVKEYNTIVDRIALNEKLNQKLEETAQALYKHWFVDFEFPNKEGKPYKSSGGKMVRNDELGKDIPAGWREGKLSELIKIKYGKDHKHLSDGTIPLFGSGGIMRYVEQSLYDEPSILIPRKGSLDNILLISTPFWAVDTMFYSKLQYKYIGYYVYYFLKTIDFYSLNVGSAVPSMTTEVLNDFTLLIPQMNTVAHFDKVLKELFLTRNGNINVNKKLKEFESVLLFKMTKG